MATETITPAGDPVPAQKQKGVISFLPLLASRMLLFLLFQAIIALAAGSWKSSEKYWLLTATLTNIVSIALLVFLFRKEGKSYLRLFHINRTTVRKDLLNFAGFTVVAGPVAFVPGWFLSTWLWGDANIPVEMMFQPVARWLVLLLVFAFPATIVFAELATYFGYIMPALAQGMKARWPAVLLPVLFLSLQHCTMPFIPDPRFILYRGLVFLPFALLVGLSLNKRPSLFPYLAILHGIMDMGTAIMLLRA
jgi:hypothetical protein